MTKQTRSTKKTKIQNVNLETQLPLASAALAADDSILSDLLEQLDGVEDIASLETMSEQGEVIEQPDEAGAIDAAAGAAIGAVDEMLLDEIIDDAERDQAKKDLYAAQGATAAPDASAPLTTPEQVTSKKKGKKKAAAPDEPKEPAAPKEPRATSVTHKPGDLLKLKLGVKAGEFLVFSVNDALNLPSEQIAEKQQAFIDRMNDREAIADKVREKITMLMVWMQKGGGPDALNEVMRRAFTVLHQEGVLTSGDKGNLQLNLLAKPYSVGTARSQANQMFMALPELGLVIKGKGSMVPNPDSALLPMINQMLGLQ